VYLPQFYTHATTNLTLTLTLKHCRHVAIVVVAVALRSS
jgi:hypothetical protein